MSAALPFIMLGASILGAASFPLTAAHHPQIANRLPRRLTRWAGGLLLAASWGLGSMILHPATAFFVTLTVSMGVLMALPTLLALVAPSRKSTR